MNLPDLSIPIEIEQSLEILCILDVLADIGFETQPDYERLLQSLKDECGSGFVELMLKSENYSDRYVMARNTLAKGQS